MDKFQIETAQNISIHQNVAHVSTRMGSFLIDVLVIAVYYILVSLLFVLVNIDPSDQWVLFLVLGLPVFFYSLFFEILWNGQTPGKRANKIRVVKLDGSKPTMGSYLLRWVLRIFDISMTYGSVAVITILVNGKGQRLGDLAAGTTVISEKKRVTLNDTISADVPDDYVPTFPQVTTLTDTDIQTIKSLYFKAKRTGNHKIILKLHVKLTALLEVKTDLKPIDFIATLIDDYNYYTQTM